MIAWGLTAFNRPLHTKRLIDVLREHRIQPLYVFIDGPQNDSDQFAVQRVRDEVKKIDWTRPTIFVRVDHLGLRKSIVGAVDEMLDSHVAMVLLEDDLVPGPHFFQFMEDCLGRYWYYDRVMSVSGYTVPLSGEASWDVYFHPRIGSWGWGTWDRAWEHYQRDFEAGRALAASKGLDLRTIGMDVPGLIDAQIAGKLDAWTPGWLLGVGLGGGLCLYPSVSHIQNKGFDGTGVHCGKTDHWETPIAESWDGEFPPVIHINGRILERVNSFYGGTLQSE